MRRTSRAAFFFFVAVVVVVSVFVLPGLTCRNVSGQMCRSVRSPPAGARGRKKRGCSFTLKEREGGGGRGGGEEGKKKKRRETGTDRRGPGVSPRHIHAEVSSHAESSRMFLSSSLSVNWQGPMAGKKKTQQQKTIALMIGRHVERVRACVCVCVCVCVWSVRGWWVRWSEHTLRGVLGWCRG